MDMFAYNLQNYTYYTKLNTAKLSAASGYRPILLQNNLIDLDAVKFGSNSNRLPNNIQRYYIDNRLYIAYS